MGDSSTGRDAIGQILRSFGRITDQDIEAALAYQRAQGGYFGEALLALGLVTPDELDWGLTSQFDIPYVFPDASSVDQDTARLVTADWALRHLTLPVVRTPDTLHVIADDPTWSEALEELEEMTGLQVQLGLASREQVHALIWGVFGEGESPPVEPPAERLTLDVFLQKVDRSMADRFGLSMRSSGTTGWFERPAGPIERVPLAPEARGALEGLLVPSQAPSSGGAASWVAQLTLGARAVTVEATRLQASTGEELLFQRSS